ncbi:DUF3072 domain-containing protein [Plantactinospora sp. WMMB334]|uniref:DUF3072 domain-containing protein n=1 Tax=Plantactinospora sp. WMMB334 TaxID=3404119 RepID=UPI003B954290
MPGRGPRVTRCPVASSPGYASGPPSGRASRDVPDGLTKAEVSQLIDELQEQTGRGGPG